MRKPKEPTVEDIKKVDMFNTFMLNKGLFIKDGDNIVMNPNPVMQGTYVYTMAEAMKDFKTAN